jgi:hypothetical protein
MTTELRCLEAGTKVPCEGPVEYRPRPSDWKMFARCEKHYELRYTNMSETERYADSAVAPPGFDEAAIGERWDSDY